MYAPVLKKSVEKTETYIERCLPVAGNMFVKVGDLVRPFDRLGECVFSQKQSTYTKSFKPLNLKSASQFYYAGANLGKMGKATIAAPYNGTLVKKDDGSFEFNATEDRYILLSGVWGVVHNIVDSRAVLIKTQTRDLLLSASTQVCISGELVVFPNPMEILEKYYLESFSKGNEGKIVYVGHFADMEVVKRASEMGAAAILAGSAYHETFNYAKSRGLGFGLISGFGKLETPEPVFKLLSIISYRYVFLDGEKNVLRIPHSMEERVVSTVPEPKVEPKVASKAVGTKKAPKRTKAPKEEFVVDQSPMIREVTKGIDVVCLQPPNFGKIGTVDSVSGSSIFVKFSSEKAAVEVKLPNFFIIE